MNTRKFMIAFLAVCSVITFCYAGDEGEKGKSDTSVTGSEKAAPEKTAVAQDVLSRARDRMRATHGVQQSNFRFKAPTNMAMPTMKASTMQMPTMTTPRVMNTPTTGMREMKISQPAISMSSDMLTSRVTTADAPNVQVQHMRKILSTPVDYAVNVDH